MTLTIAEHDLYECTDAACPVCASRDNEDDCGAYYTGCPDCGKIHCRCPEDGPNQDGGSDE
jgi:hypothetical protein